MVALSSRSEGSLAEKTVQLISDSLWARVTLAVGFVALVVLHWPDDANKSLHVHEDYHKFVIKKTDGPMALCVDTMWSDQPPEECKCSNPLAADGARKSFPDWLSHHKKLVSLATEANSNALDVVFVGDSITERMMGTRRRGTKEFPEYRVVFENVFDTAHGGKLQGMALGCSGDTSPELLYHFENGMLPKTLKPKVWVILIGTNDLGRSCSKEAALAGILHSAQVLHTARPKTPIVVHALLPRNDVYGAKEVDYSLGKRWRQIQWINRQLKEQCSLHRSLHFVDSGATFIMREDGNLKVRSNLMEDALHPTVEGYQKWLSDLSAKLVTILGE